MKKWILTIEFDGEIKSSIKATGDTEPSVPEVIGVIETVKLNFINDSVSTKEDHEKMEEKS